MDFILKDGRMMFELLKSKARNLFNSLIKCPSIAVSEGQTSKGQLETDSNLPFLKLGLHLFCIFHVFTNFQ